MTVNGTPYRVLGLLGKGKGGYSYLVERDGQHYVLKQLHHEPCDYYTFGNKLEAEQADYQKLIKTGIRIPQMLDVDVKNERILKQYIEGSTICQLVKQDEMQAAYLQQVRQMAAAVGAHGLNIDYFPTNFVVQQGLLYYIDYECNDYMDKWSFENWGIRYWSKTPEFLAYIQNHPQK